MFHIRLVGWLAGCMLPSMCEYFVLDHIVVAKVKFGLWPPFFFLRSFAKLFYGKITRGVLKAFMDLLPAFFTYFVAFLLHCWSHSLYLNERPC